MNESQAWDAWTDWIGRGRKVNTFFKWISKLSVETIRKPWSGRGESNPRHPAWEFGGISLCARGYVSKIAPGVPLINNRLADIFKAIGGVA